jgi:hypothetical protein
MQIDDRILYNLLQWAVGNRGPKTGNPYLIPEVRDTLKAIAHARRFKDVESNYFDALDKWIPEDQSTNRQG